MKKTLLSIATALCTFAAFANEPVRIAIDTKTATGKEVSPMLFGSFSEMHGGDLIPGIYEELVINPSFEPWYTQAKEAKTDLLFKPGQFKGVAVPWESRTRAGSPVFETVEEAFNTRYSQKISVAAGDTASLVQKLALPDYRTIKYNVSFYAKAEGNIRLDVFFFNKGGKRSSVLTVTDITGEWKKYSSEITVNLAKERYNDRYGAHSISFTASGDGAVYLDQATVFPSDCIEGVFNPETVEYFKEYKISCIRWPGGNFTSGYHWKSGIGPVDKRPTEPNLAWNGVNTNLLGTDEIMRFCALTGAVPVMGVGYGLLSEDEAAEWVEYCNGSVDTEMGALRAQNGHPEPYNMKYWGVGNEVYGSYQLGFTDEYSYGKGLVPIFKKMKEADSSITVLASAYGVHNSSRNPRRWTAVVDSLAGNHIDGYDAHLYVHGPKSKTFKDLPESEIFRIFAASPLFVSSYLDDYRKATGSKELAFLEWGVLPHASDERAPFRTKFTNCLLTACIMNEMIRNSDIVKMAAAHNFSFYVAPQRNHSEPVNSRTELFRMLSQAAGGTVAVTDTTGIPVYKVRQNWHDIKSWPKVPELDVASIVKGNHLYISIVNKSIGSSWPVELNISGASPKSFEGECLTSQHPFREIKWSNEEDCFDSSKLKLKKIGSNTVAAEIPPLSYSFIAILLKD